MRGTRGRLPINDMYAQGKYREFSRGIRRDGDESPQHGPVKVIFTKDPHQPIDSPTEKGRFAGQLRLLAPRCEIVLRDALKVLEPHGVFFQHSVELHGYVADFYCPEFSLVIELDGPHHKDRREYDLLRDRVLMRNGIRTLRYPSRWAHNQIDRILTDVASQIDGIASGL